MALGSPGVEVQVIDESFYTPAAPGTVPLIFVATAQDKQNASGTGTAQGTTAANAGKVWVITSQRDLVDTFGTPVFYTDATGNPIHGGELNEYGLQAAYSVLGVSSRAYITRADVNLTELVGDSDAPSGDPVNGTFWVDTDASLFGVNEWDATTNKFKLKTPLVIDNNNTSTAATLVGSSYVPKDSFGQQGDYAMVVTSNNTNQLYYKTTAETEAWTPVAAGFDGGKNVQISPHYTYPNFTTSSGIAADTGSVWIKTTTPGAGAKWSVKYYNGSTRTWTSVVAPIYDNTRQALEKSDYTGGGKNIPVNTVFVESDYDHIGSTGTTATSVASFKVWRRNATGNTIVVSEASTGTVATTSTFVIRETLASSSTWSVNKTVTIPANSTTSLASLIPAAVSAAGLTNVTASYNASTKKVTFTHALGGDFELRNGTNSPLTVIGLTSYNPVNGTGTANLYAAPVSDYVTPGVSFNFLASNWKPLSYEATANAPKTKPVDGRLWFDTKVSEVDIMVHNGTKWVGYRELYTATDPMGPIVAALEPDRDTGNNSGGALADKDIWISTANPERYGKDVYVWDGNQKVWVLQDVTDQESPDGWLFADARWATTGAATEPSDIEDLLLSSYVDPDAPDPALYPRGMKLWNLRRSGNNVKKYVVNHIDTTANEGLNPWVTGDDLETYVTDRWVTISPNNENGSGTFGRLAQRGYVVSKLKAMIDTNQAIRDTDTLVFNLIACPGYTETIANMVSFNTDRKQTAFVIGDTPFRLQPNGTVLTNWGNNTSLAFDNGEEGAVTNDEYLGMFYPSGYTTDNTGKRIVVPPSHMMLRTFINSDAKSYQWFAPAGTRRGGVDNATSVGYIDSTTGEFKTVALYEGLRNVMKDVKINPIATFPGIGIVNFAQYTRARNASALDRINVVRLICYLRRQLEILAKPFLFEPNDAQTRREIKAAAESLLLELVGQRALYDFIVVCDESNNTPARIDRSELYMDVAIEPVKAVEFIYIPLRIKNTGEIAAGV